MEVKAPLEANRCSISLWNAKDAGEADRFLKAAKRELAKNVGMTIPQSQVNLPCAGITISIYPTFEANQLQTEAEGARILSVLQNEFQNKTIRLVFYKSSEPIKAGPTSRFDILRKPQQI